jgi:hypothetical protein
MTFKEKRTQLKQYFKSKNTIGKILVKRKYVYLMPQDCTIFNPMFDEKITIEKFYNLIFNGGK